MEKFSILLKHHNEIHYASFKQSPGYVEVFGENIKGIGLSCGLPQ